MIPSHISVAEQISYFENISYIGIFIAVAFSGHIVPVPEDVIFLLVGYIAAIRVVHLSYAIAVSIVAIVLADFLLYYLSYTGKKFAVSIEKRIKVNIFNKYVDLMNRRTFAVMFVSRFVPGLRVINPLVAGFVKINKTRFIVYSFISASLYVPLMILVGFFLHSKIITLITAVESTRRFLFIGIVVAIGVALTIFVNKKFFSNKSL